MNPPKVNEYDYINFLIATQKAYSCMEAERVHPESQLVAPVVALGTALIGLQLGCR